MDQFVVKCTASGSCRGDSGQEYVAGFKLLVLSLCHGYDGSSQAVRLNSILTGSDLRAVLILKWPEPPQLRIMIPVGSVPGRSCGAGWTQESGPHVPVFGAQFTVT